MQGSQSHDTPNNLKIGSIIAGLTCETHRLINFLDTLLKLFHKHTESYIKDDLDLLNYCP